MNWNRLLLACVLVSIMASQLAFAEMRVVPGHIRFDEDGNGVPDAGSYVNGHYYAYYAYDAYGRWYFDRGDGRIQGYPYESLDQNTLTTCDYIINYRGEFGNDPSLSSGWVHNIIKQTGYDGDKTYHYLIVHKDDPRYMGDPRYAIWGDWEYHVYISSGEGNLAKGKRNGM